MSGTVVLIVEDNAINMELAVDLLQTAGFEILQAFSAEDGIRIARESRPDIILMDVSLPGMDGLQATRTLKVLDDTRTIPIVALTAHAMKGDEARALAAGCNGYIPKPVNSREFARTVRSFLTTATEVPPSGSVSV